MEKKEKAEFGVIVKAKDLVKHSFIVTNSTTKFPKKYRFTIVTRIQNRSVDIFDCIVEANELDLNDTAERTERLKLQAKVMTYCKELLFYIELSQDMGFITISSCEYWVQMVVNVKNMTAAWHKRDKARAIVP